MQFKDMLSGMPRADPHDHIIKGNFAIKKSVNEEMLAFGWANVAVRSNGETVEDYHEDVISPEELEHAAYLYIENSRDGGEEHVKGGVAHIVESMVFTPQKLESLGLPADSLPTGWWIGMRVTDPDVWEKVKDGTYSMFSIEGEAVRKEI